jgi:hypothetical protein
VTPVPGLRRPDAGAGISILIVAMRPFIRQGGHAMLCHGPVFRNVAEPDGRINEE